jgi:hypothetical protein
MSYPLPSEMDDSLLGLRQACGWLCAHNHSLTCFATTELDNHLSPTGSSYSSILESKITTLRIGPRETKHQRHHSCRDKATSKIREIYFFMLFLSTASNKLIKIDNGRGRPNLVIFSKF